METTVIFMITLLALITGYHIFTKLDDAIIQGIKTFYKQYTIECTTTTEKGLHEVTVMSWGVNKKHAKARFYKMYGSKYKVVSLTRQ